MKKVQRTIGRWIQRIARKTQPDAPTQPTRRPRELDSQALAQVSGGDGGSVQLPTKGW